MKKRIISYILSCFILIFLLFACCTCSTQTATRPSSSGQPSESGTVSTTSRSGTAAPLTPANLEASALSSTTVEIRWLDNSNNEDGFNIYRGTALVGTVPANSNLFQDTGLQPKSSYQYAVRAYNQAGESPVATCSVTTPGPPSTPSDLHAGELSHTAVWLIWVDNSNDEAGFKIYRDGAPITTTGADISLYQDTNLQPATSYEYTVLAYNQYGDSMPCTVTLKTRNPPLTIRLDTIGVYDNRESMLRGAGDIYVLIGIADGSVSRDLKLPSEQGQTYTLDKNQAIALGETIYSTNEVSDNLQLIFIGYESDGGAFEQLAYEALGLAVDYYTGGVAGGLSEAFDISLTDIIGGLLGEEDDFLGQYELKCNRDNNWGIGQYNDIVLQDERGVDCLRLWFTIE
jgi:hypothetical protein